VSWCEHPTHASLATITIAVNISERRCHAFHLPKWNTVSSSTECWEQRLMQPRLARLFHRNPVLQHKTLMGVRNESNCSPIHLRRVRDSNPCIITMTAFQTVALSHSANSPIAEDEGFEPSVHCCTVVFETTAISHSANLPIAEGEGFEPPDPLRGQRFSRPPL
jgi:hypothetical protein